MWRLFDLSDIVDLRRPQYRQGNYLMSKVDFKCPGCGQNLTVLSEIEIKSVEDIEGTTCANCGRVIHKSDIDNQALNHVDKLVRDMLGKHLK
ncbi:ECs_2282 family putative zinc-binding protein [Klebsiella variicola]|uniref:ECs_2282 family putative zinc-binding protein n=1 Tax=Klebsiella variicola TaxID=244366 RepID=UPI00403C23E2